MKGFTAMIEEQKAAEDDKQKSAKQQERERAMERERMAVVSKLRRGSIMNMNMARMSQLGSVMQVRPQSAKGPHAGFFPKQPKPGNSHRYVSSMSGGSMPAPPRPGVGAVGGRMPMRPAGPRVGAGRAGAMKMPTQPTPVRGASGMGMPKPPQPKSRAKPQTIEPKINTGALSGAGDGTQASGKFAKKLAARKKKKKRDKQRRAYDKKVKGGKS